MFSFSKKTQTVFIVFSVFVLIGAIFIFIISRKNSGTSGETSQQDQLLPGLPQTSQQDASSPDEPSSLPQTNPAQIQFPQNEYSITEKSTYSYEEIAKNSEFLDSIKSTEKDFSLDDVGVSHPSASAKTKNGDEIVIFSGCQPHNCGGTEKIIAFDKKTKKSYILAEKYSTTLGYEILGNPPDEIKDLLIFYYKNK